jgi:hypothetical protein
MPTAQQYQDFVAGRISTTNDLAKMQVPATEMLNVIKACLAFDRIKRQAFYDKKPDASYEHKMDDMLLAASDAATVVSLMPFTTLAHTRIPAHLIHAIFGKVSELGELMQSMLLAVADHTAMDPTNLVEEFGDDAFYTQLALNAMGVTDEIVREANMAKLRKRYPDPTDVAATAGQDRDVAGEAQAISEVVNAAH